MEKDKMIIRTQWNRVKLDSDVEHPIGSSLTEPDQSYSIREILERFSRGNAPAVERDVSYDIDKSYDEPLDDSDYESNPLSDGDFDLADIPDMQEKAIQRVSRIKQDIKDANDKKVKNEQSLENE